MLRLRENEIVLFDWWMDANCYCVWLMFVSIEYGWVMI
jgi:hypothetical protein